MQHEGVVVTFVVGMLFMWVVYMHYECVIATLVVEIPGCFVGFASHQIWDIGVQCLAHSQHVSDLMLDHELCQGAPVGKTRIPSPGFGMSTGLEWSWGQTDGWIATTEGMPLA